MQRRIRKVYQICGKSRRRLSVTKGEGKKEERENKKKREKKLGNK
jgi:hypothetical protein